MQTLKIGAQVKCRLASKRATQQVRACHGCCRNEPSRRSVLGAGAATLTSALLSAQPAQAFMLPGFEDAKEKRIGEVKFTEEEWQKRLSQDAYLVLRKAATELPGTSPLNGEKRKGTFVCAGCGSPLFKSDAKYNSGTGWPSFYEPIKGAVDETPDYSIAFMPRTEVRCHTCQGHLGHVFDDGPRPTGLRYCMNGLAMAFVPDGSSPSA